MTDIRYRVFSSIELPPDATSPMMDSRQMEQQLNAMYNERGLEFIGYAETKWHSGNIQSWWIFKQYREKP